MIQLLPGDIVILNNKKGGIYQKLIRFFTRQPWTHSATVIGDVLNFTSVFEADRVMTINPVSYFMDHPENFSYEVYRIKNIKKENIDFALKKIYSEFSGTPYATFQLLWFLWRYILESFGKNTTGMKNWFTNNTECSELVWNYLHWVSINDADVLSHVQPYNGNTTTPGDIRLILNSHPNKYELLIRSK